MIRPPFSWFNKRGRRVTLSGHKFVTLSYIYIYICIHISWNMHTTMRNKLQRALCLWLLLFLTVHITVWLLLINDLCSFFSHDNADISITVSWTDSNWLQISAPQYYAACFQVIFTNFTINISNIILITRAWKLKWWVILLAHRYLSITEWLKSDFCQVCSIMLLHPGVWL